MRILWITAMPIKNIASSQKLKSSGGWIGSMIHSLNNNKEVNKIQVLSIGNYKAFELIENNIEYIQIIVLSLILLMQNINFFSQ